jgi:hypothetical protein
VGFLTVGICIGIYELVPDDDVFAQAGCEVVKTIGQSGYNAELPS